MALSLLSQQNIDQPEREIVVGVESTEAILHRS